MDTLNIALWFAAGLVFLLGPIILIHELGHFLAARRAGVRVEEFGLGFPPRILTLWGEPGVIAVGNVQLRVPRRLTLPIGVGLGMQVEATARRGTDGSYYLVGLRPLGGGGPTDDGSILRERPDDYAVIRGLITLYEPGIRYTLNWLPFGGFVRMTGEENPSDPRSLAAQPKRWRLAVLLAGPAMNLLVAFLLLAIGYATGYPEQMHVMVERVEPGTAAEEAGLLPGDRILSIDGEEIITGPVQVREIILNSAGQSLLLEVERNGTSLQLTATPRLVGGRWLLGIAMEAWPDPESLYRYPLPQALGMAVQDIYRMLDTLVHLPTLLSQGEISAREARPTSAVGINSILTLALQQSLEWRIPFPALEMAALVSFFLGLTNLLPLPALDGGRVLFVLIEAVRGRRIRPEVEALVHQVGMFVLLALMLFLVVQDIVNPVVAWSLLNR